MPIHTVVTIVTMLLVAMALCHDLRPLLSHRRVCAIGAGQGLPAVVCDAVAVCRQRVPARCSQSVVLMPHCNINDVCASTLVFSRGLYAAPLRLGGEQHHQPTSSTSFKSIDSWIKGFQASAQ